jgi:hypothetical protein
MTCGRLYVYDTLLEGLAQDLKDMAAELRQLIQKQHAMMGQGYLARQRHLPPTDQPDIRNGGAGRDTGGW